MRVFILLFILIGVYSGTFAQENKWTIHSTDTYTISYPAETWEVATTGEMGTKFILWSKLQGLEDTFKEAITMMEQNITGYNLSLDKYAEMIKAQIPVLMENAEILNSKTESGDKGSYHRMVLSAEKDGVKMTVIQYLYVTDTMAYALTFSCLPKEFEALGPKADKIMQTFKIK